MKFVKLKPVYACALFLGSSIISSPVLAESSSPLTLMASNTHATNQTTTISSLDQFTPQTQTRKSRIDYSVLNDALGGTVIWLGPSTRRHMSRPNPPS